MAHIFLITTFPKQKVIWAVVKGMVQSNPFSIGFARAPKQSKITNFVKIRGCRFGTSI